MKKIILLLISISLFSCGSTAEVGSSKRKVLRFVIRNAGYSSAQMSLNQINATIKNIAALCVYGAEFTYNKNGEVSFVTDSSLSYDLYNSITEDRAMDMLNNQYRITEKGNIKYTAPALIGPVINVSQNLPTSGLLLSNLMIQAVKRGASPGKNGRLYLTSNISLYEDEQKGAALFVVLQ